MKKFKNEEVTKQMEILIGGTPEEITALLLPVQTQQSSCLVSNLETTQVVTGSIKAKDLTPAALSEIAQNAI